MEDNVMIIPFEEGEYKVLEDKSIAWGVDKGEVLRVAVERLMTEINSTIKILQEYGFHAELREASHEKKIIEQYLYDFDDYQVVVENRKPRRRGTSRYSVAVNLLKMPSMQEESGHSGDRPGR